MGHNRAGVRRKARLKRQQRELERLAEKAPRGGEGGAREAGQEAHGGPKKPAPAQENRS